MCIISPCNTYNIDFGACRTHSFLIAIVIWLYVEGQLSTCGTRAYWKRTLRGGLSARIFANFGENHGKLRTARSTSAIEVWTCHLPSTSLSATTLPLVGLKYMIESAEFRFENSLNTWGGRGDQKINKLLYRSLICFIHLFKKKLCCWSWKIVQDTGKTRSQTLIY